MKHKLWFLVFGIALAACRNEGASPAGSAAREDAAPSAATNEQQTARLNEWLDARFEEQLAFSPIQQTMLGRKTSYDKIDEFSEAEQDRQLAWQRATVEELKRSFDYAALTPEGKTSYDLWVYGLERADAVLPFRRRFYVFTQMGGQHTGLPQVLINFHTVDDAADMRAYVARIGEVARITGIKPYVLRYWEGEFRWMTPVKSRSHQRLYRARDIEVVELIKRLLYVERFTIEGAKKKLREIGMEAALDPSQLDLALGADPLAQLKRIRESLLEVQASLLA